MIEEHLSVCVIVGLDRVRGSYPFYPPRILTYYDEDSKHWLGICTSSDLTTKEREKR